MKQRIAVLRPFDDEGPDADYPGFAASSDPARHAPHHEWSLLELRQGEVERTIASLAGRFDVAFNFCDDPADQEVPGIEVVRALERSGLPFTGACSGFLEPTREEMKAACASVGVAVPAWVMARDAADLARAEDLLRSPLIVKHPNGYGSVGMTRDSRVTTPSALRTEFERVRGLYGAALIEEFIEGDEFTVLVTEPRHASEPAWGLWPAQVHFPSGESFKHFDLKWKTYAELETRPVADPGLAARLVDASVRMFRAMNGTGYARCDLRMGRDGEPVMLEINPNCAIFYPEGDHASADAILAHTEGGPGAFIEHLLACAAARSKR